MRGEIIHKVRTQQIRDFTQLVYGKITPTDIDALIEYHNKAYVIIEAKHENANIPYGQALALERLCDDLSIIKKCLLVIARHNTKATDEINFAACQVEKYRYKNEWRTTKKNTKELIDAFLKSLEKE